MSLEVVSHEYKVVPIRTLSAMENTLNHLALHGWKVVEIMPGPSPRVAYHALLERPIYERTDQHVEGEATS